VITPERKAVLDAVDQLADAIIVRGGCGEKVPEKRFRDAPILCLAITAAAVTSAAVEDPARTTAAIPRLEHLIDLALAPAAQRAYADSGTVNVGDRSVPRSVLYRGLLGLALAGHERLSPGTALTPMFDGVATSLAADLAIGLGWLPSYGPDDIYPCDHAPAVSALRLHAMFRGNAATERAADALAIRIRDLLGGAGGFPTRLTAKGAVADAGPRGTTLAFAAGFLLPGQPQLAGAFADELVTSRCARGSGTAIGCREWPAGERHKPDATSGPIAKDGTAPGATAFAMAATRALATSDWNADLVAAARAAGTGTLDPAKHPFALALVLWGETARSWKP
jgi:hypothetical protein